MQTLALEIEYNDDVIGQFLHQSLSRYEESISDNKLQIILEYNLSKIYPNPRNHTAKNKNPREIYRF